MAPLRPPLVPAELGLRETPTVSFGDLLRMLGEGIADAQASLDRASAELVVELAETKVEVVSSIVETISPDGQSTFQQGDRVELSLLELGVTPTFYQFSQATVEVTMDVRVVETETTTTDGKRRVGLFAGTESVRTERRLNRDVRTAAKLTATLVPVPAPIRVNPVRTTTTPAPPP